MSNNINVLKILNSVGFISTVIVNTLANTLPINGLNTGELSDMYPNLFTPAGYVFSIWGVIYILLLAFIYYQFSSRSKSELYIKKIGYLFFISCIANILWIFLWHYQYVEISLLAMFTLLGSLIWIYLKLDIGHSEVSQDEKRFVHLPFSVYLGWITVAPIANVAAAFVNNGWNDLLFGEQLWTVIMITIAVVLTLLVINQRGDSGYSLVIVWALSGILVKQMELQLVASAAGLGIVIIMGFLVYNKFIARG